MFIIFLAVFGFFDGPEVPAVESGEFTLLEVGFVKGEPFDQFLLMTTRGLRFMVIVTAGTAGGFQFLFQKLSYNVQYPAV